MVVMACCTTSRLSRDCRIISFTLANAVLFSSVRAVLDSLRIFLSGIYSVNPAGLVLSSPVNDWITLSLEGSSNFPRERKPMRRARTALRGISGSRRLGWRSRMKFLLPAAEVGLAAVPSLAIRDRMNSLWNINPFSSPREVVGRADSGGLRAGLLCLIDRYIGGGRLGVAKAELLVYLVLWELADLWCGDGETTAG